MILHDEVRNRPVAAKWPADLGQQVTRVRYPMKIDSLDHVVLTVKEIDATCKFYAKVLGMEIVTFGGNRKALSFGSQKINLQQLGRESTLIGGKAHTRFSRCL